MIKDGRLFLGVIVTASEDAVDIVWNSYRE